MRARADAGGVDAGFFTDNMALRFGPEDLYMIFRMKMAAAALMLVALPVAADAQGFVGGARSGFDDGNQIAGPIGGVVGGAIGAGVGTVRGAIGLDAPLEPVLVPAGDGYAPRYRRHHRRHIRHGHYYR